MDVGEYLCGSFDVPVIERNIGELPHGKAQGNIYVLLFVSWQTAWEFSSFLR